MEPIIHPNKKEKEQKAKLKEAIEAIFMVEEQYSEGSFIRIVLLQARGKIAHVINAIGTE